MIHLPQLISDLALILIAAACTTLLFKKINQPLVLGYIIAGLLVGPHFKFLPTVTDDESISIWAEIGVIFLLFSLGLEFSFKKLAKVGGAASITGITEAAMMFGVGYLTGMWMDWSTMDSIFLGGILSISSTTIIIRAFEELKVKHKKFAGLIFGVLIVEDLIAILLMVLLTTLSVSKAFSGGEMLMSILKFAFFLILWFLGGIFLIPTFLKKAKSLMNDETLLIVSIALCLLMVVLAVAAGFSPALGAFIMGSILAETTAAEKIEHLTKSVKDLFAAIFFVSVGMLIDPKVLLEYSTPILIITVVTIFGKIISTTAGALLSGQPLKVSVQSGMSVAQIGEFSFIIATLGLSLKVTSPYLYPIAVAVSAITTFTTPYLIKYSEPFANYLDRKLPKKWIDAINKYSSDTAGITTTSDWKILLRAYLTNAVVHAAILIGILFLSRNAIEPFVTEHIGDDIYGTTIGIFATFILMAPFLWAFAIRRIERTAYSHLWLNKKYSRGPLIMLELIRIALAIGFINVMLNIFLNTAIAVFIALIITILVFSFFSRKLQSFYNRLENRFFGNLNDRENSASSKASELAPWDTHLSELVISPESSIAGYSLKDLSIREKFGVNIAQIDRGRLQVISPGPDAQLMPHDRLTVIGTDEQLEKFRGFLDTADTNLATITDEEDVRLQKLVVSSNSPLANTSIRNTGIREKAQGLIVGIERDRTRLLNPESDFELRAGDIIWIVGNAKKISTLQ